MSMEEVIRDLIVCIGDFPDRDGLQETPHRVHKAYVEHLFCGYKQDPALLLKSFDEEYSGMVVAKNIPLYSTCEHHMLPFYGKAHIAYIPKRGRVVGASKLTRLLNVYAKRLQIQERIAEQVTDAIMKFIKPTPFGAACLIDATHMCMTARGVKTEGSTFVTPVYKGAFLDDMNTRQEFLALVK